MRSVLLRAVTPVLAALAGLVLAACGGQEELTAAVPAAPPAAGAPAAVVPQRTDGRLGDATTATSAGERVVARGRRIDPSVAAPPRGPREGVDGAAACGAVDAQPSAGTVDAVNTATLCLLNAERTSRGLVALTSNAKLVQAALAQVNDMVARKYFAHESPDGSTPADRIRAAGYIPDEASWTVGENLAWGTGALATPAAIVRAWMNSPGHRDNLLKADYREIGLAIVLGVPRAGLDGGATYATTFGAVEGAQAAGDGARAAAQTAAGRDGAARPAATSKKRTAKKPTKKLSAKARAAKARAAKARAAKARAAKARAAKARAAKARAAKARAAKARAAKARAAKARAARARAAAG